MDLQFERGDSKLILVQRHNIGNQFKFWLKHWKGLITIGNWKWIHDLPAMSITSWNKPYGLLKISLGNIFGSAILTFISPDPTGLGHNSNPWLKLP